MSINNVNEFLGKINQIPSFSERVKLANEELSRMGSGTGRIVYDLGDDKVFKLAKNIKGIAQNEVEIDISSFSFNNNIVTKVDKYDDNGEWLIVEKSKKVSEKVIKEITGIPSLDDLWKFLKNKTSNEDMFKISNEVKDMFDKNEWVQELQRLVLDHAQDVSELKKPSTFGIVNKNGRPAIVLSDYGLSDEVYSTHYSPKRDSFKLYEMIDMNRGGIYQEFTDGNEIRKSSWALQPASVSDEYGTVNEDFVNFVENRNNYNVRMPIFSLSILGEEFEKSVKNLKPYLEKANDNRVFLENLMKLQEYLVEQSHYNKDQIIFENEEPMKKAMEISRENADKAAMVVAKEKGFPTPKHLGGGSYGRAYLIGDKALKITTDQSEILAGGKIRKSHPKAIAYVYNLWEINNTTDNEIYYALETEYVPDKPVSEFNRFIDVYNDIAVASDNFDFVLLLKKVINKKDFNYPEFIEDMKFIFNANPELNISDEDRKKVYNFIIGIGFIRNELIKIGLLRVKDYGNMENLGYLNNILTHFDVGGDRRAEAPVFDKESVIMMSENVINDGDKTEIFNKLKNYIDIPQMTYIGSGEYGDAYDIGNDRVLKFTTDKSEMNESLSIKGKYFKHIADIYDVFKITSKSNENKELYVIVLEKLDTKINEFEKHFDRLEYIFENVFSVNFYKFFENYMFSHGLMFKSKKPLIDKYMSKNLNDEKFFYGLISIANELKNNNIDTDDFLNPSNLGYKKTGLLGFFDLGIGDENKKLTKEPDSLQISEDGTSLYSTDNSIGNDDFGTYNQNSSQPPIENNLNANSAMYNEDLEYRHVRGDATNDEYVIEESLIQLSKSDYQRLSNEDALKYFEKLKDFEKKITNNEYLSHENVSNIYFIIMSMYYNKEKYSSLFSFDTYEDKFHYFLKILKDWNFLSEDRKKAWIPGSKSVTVKKKCRLGGNADGTSVACNQGDVNNLEFGSLTEEISIDNDIVSGWNSYSIKNDDEVIGEIELSNREQYLILNKIFINPEHRNKDYANDMMNILFEYADNNNKIIALTPDNIWGANKLKLKKWYISLGFKINRGRNADYQTRELMLKQPNLNEDLEVSEYFSKSDVLSEADIMQLKDLPFKDEVEQLGGKIFSVGGAVRDEFLGKESKDLDILITGIPMEKLEELLSKYGKVDKVGASFGVLKFKPEGSSEDIDIAIPRTETSTGEGGHKGFDVSSDHELPIEDDLMRRDFTINAIAKDIDGNLIDPFNGQEDLKNKIIRIVNPVAFADDPLRMLRAVQFASRFGFVIEPTTMEMIKTNAEKIKEIPPERILIEFDKIVKKGNKLIGVQLLQETGLFKQIFGFDLPISVIQNSNFNNVQTMGEFIYLMTSNMSNPAEFYKNDLKGDINTYKEIKALEVAFNAGEETNQAIARTIAHNMYTSSPESLNSNILSNSVKQAAYELLQGKYPKTIGELAINGNDLMKFGLKGKEIGDALKKMLINIYTEKVSNNKEELLSLIFRKTG